MGLGRLEGAEPAEGASGVTESLQKQIETATRQAAEAVSRVLDSERTDAKTVRDMVAALKDLHAMTREQNAEGETLRIVFAQESEDFGG